MSTTTTNGSIETNEKDLSTNSSARYQQLKQRKLNLEKKLGEKYELLHKLCQEEANLVGILTNNINTEEASTSAHNTLRRKVGTSFKSYIIPDSLLNINNDEDDINKLFLEKQIQQQISEASLRLSNDRSQTKPIRRTHKQSYEISQQKLAILNQNISILTQRHPVSQDDINLHRNNNNHQKNLLAATGNSSTLNHLNSNNQMMFSERRNSMKSTTSSLGSGNTFFVQSPSSIKPTPSTSLTSLKPQAQNRTRHDSCNNRLDYMINQQSPTPSIYSFQSHQQPPSQPLPQVPQSFSSQSMKNIQINDDNYSLHHHPSSASHSFNHQLQLQQQQQQQQIRPYPTENLLHRVQSLNQQLNYQNQQYLNQQHMYATMSNQTMAMSPDDSDFVDSNHASYYVDDAKENHTKLPSQNAQVRYQKMTSASSSNLNPMYYPSQSHTVGLGGFWTKTDNNERVWCTDNKFPQSPQMSNAALKSNSLGNFDFQNMSPDSISISSGTSNENKKKEKIWRETSLDGPVQAKTKPPPIKLLNQQDIVNNNLHSPNSNNNNNSPTPILYQQHQQQQQQQQQLLQQQQHILMTNMYKHLSHRSSSNPNTVPIGDNLYFSPSEEQQQLKSTPPPPSDPNLYYYPTLPPKSKLKHTESTRSVQSAHVDASSNQFRDQENNNISMLSSPTLNGTIQTESPKNMGRIVQQGSWKPYKEETKAYEISDFYKYSTKFRQQK